jgi:hypothetical protein
MLTGIKVFLGGIFLVFTLLVVVLLPDWSFLYSEIKAYPVDCQSELVKGHCRDKLDTNDLLNPMVYTVYRDQQTVVRHNVGAFPPRRYTNCAIVRRETWQCTYDDKSGAFGFTDGKYWTVDYADGSSWSAKHTYYVSNLELFKMMLHLN